MSKVYGKIDENENCWSFEGLTIEQLKELIQAADDGFIDSIEETLDDLAILPAIIKDLISEVENKQ